MIANTYWAGAFPGLVIATAVSLCLALGLARPGLKHIVWLVPFLHFLFALVVGPALSLTYGLAIIPVAGSLAGWAWLAAFLLLAAGVLVARRSRAISAQSGPWPAAAAAGLIIAGALVPPFYQLIAA